MAALTIATLPFHERPVRELLHLGDERIAAGAAVDRDYAGYGWARVGRLWLATGDERGTPLDDVLVLALHSADDGEALADDVELEFELPAPGAAQGPAHAPPPSVAVLASDFLARWLPRLPGDVSAIVLALCNPHHAVLRVATGLPLHYADGDVESWLDRDDEGDHLRLVAPSWSTLAGP